MRGEGSGYLRIRLKCCVLMKQIMYRLHAKVKVRLKEVSFDDQGERSESTQLVETTVGRILLWSIVPEGLPFKLIDRPLTKKAISGLLNSCYRTLGTKDTVIFADQLMYTGYKYATTSAISIGLNDLVVPAEKRGNYCES